MVAVSLPLIGAVSIVWRNHREFDPVTHKYVSSPDERRLSHGKHGHVGEDHDVMDNSQDHNQ